MPKDLIFLLIVIGALFLYFLVALIKSIRMVPAKSEYIVERLGKYSKTLEAGFHLLVPIVEKVVYIQNLKEMTIDVPSQECFTKDEIQVEVDGVIYLQVIDSVKASYGITDYQFASIQLAQTTTRAIVGTLDLDRTFEERESISAKVVAVLDDAAQKWGVKILRFEIKNLIPPESVRKSMEKLVTAERDKRAILEAAYGQKQSLINTSEGTMAEMINISEGEKAKLINEAEGKAQEILALGKATAESIRKIANAINSEGGKEAIKLELSQKYFTKIGGLTKNKNKVIFPGDLTKMNELLESLGIEV
ncbi:MAG: paraslipin [Spirochaetes bacterium]|nr:paraslipin [Spirochaetota bacterium]